MHSITRLRVVISQFLSCQPSLIISRDAHGLASRSLRTSSLRAPQVPRKSAVQEQLHRRGFSSERDRASVGVFTPLSAALFVAAGTGLFFYFRYEKARLKEEREKERASRAYGRPKLGGPFSLGTHDGKTFTEKDLEGKWSLVYFGFTNCPDICPAEMDKVTDIMNVVEKEYGNIFQPVFVTVDPARDSPARVAKYLKDFHERYVGLIGDYDSTKVVCKAYRVYFSTPPNADPNGDYLVDHSIFVYLMDPEGKFVDAFGQNVTKEEAVQKIHEALADWKKETGSVV